MALINDVINDEGITTLDVSDPETGNDAEPGVDVVSTAYLTFLAREATETEITHWNELANAGMSSADISAAIANSEEATTIVVPIRSIYQAILNRLPSQDELGEAAAKVRGGDTLEDIRDLLSGSGEAAPDPAATELFVADLYQRLLDRTPDDAGLVGWVHSGKYWGEIVDGFVNSSEYQATRASNSNEVRQSEANDSHDVLAALVSPKTRAQDQLDEYIGNLSAPEASGVEDVAPVPLSGEDIPSIQWAGGYAVDAENAIILIGGNPLGDNGLE